jgi:hypothetical protein
MNAEIIVSIIFAVLLAAGYVFIGQKDAIGKIKALLLEFTVQAEKMYGQGTGQLKKAHVIHLILNSSFYIRLPNIIKLFVNENTLDVLIDSFVGSVFNAMKDSNEKFKEVVSG